MFGPAAEAAGLANARPYDLRHAYVSLLIREGVSVVEVARQAGHSPTMALDTHGHVFAELEGAEKVSAEAEIRRARDELVPVSYLEEPAPADGDRKTPANPQAQHRTRTDDPFLTMDSDGRNSRTRLVTRGHFYPATAPIGRFMGVRP